VVVKIVRSDERTTVNITEFRTVEIVILDNNLIADVGAEGGALPLDVIRRHPALLCTMEVNDPVETPGATPSLVHPIAHYFEASP
jgi:hypothetical protein